MTKQKAIVRVCMVDEKSRKKAMKTVVGHSGVESASIQEKDKNLIEVVGEEIDCVVLTRLLRKRIGFAELISVNPIPPADKKDKDGGGEKKDKEEITVPAHMFFQHYPYNGWGGYNLEVRDDPNCNIL